ncbi:hypothetical protein L3Q82_015568, partial [Scortum barcoo]
MSGAESNILERPPQVDRVRSQLTPHCCHRTLSLPGRPRVPAATLPHLNEEEVTVPSAHALARRCRKIWAAARLDASSRTGLDEDRSRSPPRVLHQSTHRARKCGCPRRTCRFMFTPGNSPQGSSLRVHPTFQVSKLKPVRESPLVPPTKPPLLSKMVAGGPVYKVNKLLAVRKRGWGRQFLVDWEGYGPQEGSWIPASFMMFQQLLPAPSRRAWTVGPS